MFNGHNTSSGHYSTTVQSLSTTLSTDRPWQVAPESPWTLPVPSAGTREHGRRPRRWCDHRPPAAWTREWPSWPGPGANRQGDPTFPIGPPHSLPKHQDRGTKMQPKPEEQLLQILVQGQQPLTLHTHVEHGLFLAADVAGGWFITHHGSVQHSPPQM